MKIDFSKPETTEFIRVWWLSFVLTPIAVYFMVTRGTYTFADNAELFVHEMGHLVFAPMGAPLRMAGGTLLQIIVPLGLAVYAYSYDTAAGFACRWRRQRHARLALDARRDGNSGMGRGHRRRILDSGRRVVHYRYRGAKADVVSS